MNNNLLPLAFSIFAFLVGDLAARADDGSVQGSVDLLGRITRIVPRQHTSVQMRSERVTLVPFYDTRVSRYPVVLVNAKFEFFNPGKAENVLMGFPEMRGVARNCAEAGAFGPHLPKRQACSQPEDKWPSAALNRPTIAAFVADRNGSPLQVQGLPGEKDYRRWFTFTIPMASAETVRVRNLYVAYLSTYNMQESSGCDGHYFIDYVLHTGATWSGTIGEGEILVRGGGFEISQRFTKLKPMRADDMHISIGVFEEPTRDTGCGYFNPDRLVRASSSRASTTLGSYAALVLDGDPTTSWVDGEQEGGVGAWVQVPTLEIDMQGDTRPSSLIRNVRGLALQSGIAAAGLARPASVSVDCVTVDDESGDPKRDPIGKYELKDVSSRQEISFAKPQHCLSVRLTATKLYGKPTDHITIGELEPLF